MRMPTRTPVVVGDRDARDPVALHELERVGDEVARRGASRARRSSPTPSASPCRPRRPDRRSRGCGARSRARPRARARSRRRASVTVSIAAETSGMFERDRRCQPRDRRDVVREDVRLGRKEQNVVEREPFLAELPLERDEALDLVLAELGLHARDVSERPPTADSGDLDTARPRAGREVCAAPATSPLARRTRRLSASGRSRFVLLAASACNLGEVRPEYERAGKKSVVSARPTALRRCSSACVCSPRLAWSKPVTTSSHTS